MTRLSEVIREWTGWCPGTPCPGYHRGSGGNRCAVYPETGTG